MIDSFAGCALTSAAAAQQSDPDYFLVLLFLAKSDQTSGVDTAKATHHQAIADVLFWAIISTKSPIQICSLLAAASYQCPASFSKYPSR